MCRGLLYLVIFMVIMTLSPVTVSAANPGIWVNNHAFGNQIVKNATGFTLDYFITYFTSGNLQFMSIDQFVANKGTYQIKQEIVESSSGKVVGWANPFVITASANQYTHTTTTTWRIALGAGWYEYRLTANGSVIAEFSFFVSN